MVCAPWRNTRACALGFARIAGGGLFPGAYVEELPEDAPRPDFGEGWVAKDGDNLYLGFSVLTLMFDITYMERFWPQLGEGLHRRHAHPHPKPAPLHQEQLFAQPQPERASRARGNVGGRVTVRRPQIALASLGSAGAAC